MKKLYQVIASRLNFRSSPAVLNNNIIRVLQKSQVLEVLDSANDKWWKITVAVNDNKETGFVSRDWIEPIEDLKKLEAVTALSEVNLPSNTAATRTARWKWHYPLSENNMPVRDFSSLEQNIKSQYAIVNYLDVDNPSNLRYAKTTINSKMATFCNIYAHDYCKLNQVFLPRVWWTESAIQHLLQNEELTAAYDVTVTELTANALFDWLTAWGGYFGWIRVSSWQEAQNMVNTKGAIGLICSRRKPAGFSGHIACILPESSYLNLDTIPGRGKDAPLLSQAGSVNFKFKYDKWSWDNANKYSGFGFWYNLNGL